MKEQLSHIISDVAFMGPELLITLLLLLAIALEIIAAHRVKEQLVQGVVGIGLLGVLGLDISQLLDLAHTVKLFGGLFTLDQSAALWKAIMALGAFITVIISKNRRQEGVSGEYYMCILSILIGAQLLVMASNLLSVYLAFELISLSSYILATFSFNRHGMEGGLKYLLFGAVASAIMLYGMSLLYGIAGTLQFTGSVFVERLIEADPFLFSVSGIMILGGILFKIGVVPFHIWAPDVYTAAPAPVAGFFSVVPKLAGFALLMRWMLVANLFGMSAVDWSVVLAVLAGLSMLVGNFGALRQTNVKRMLAYSSIAHSGFLLVGLVAFSEPGYTYVFFYGVVYLLMNLGVFMMAHWAQSSYGYIDVADYAGFVKLKPLQTVVFLILLLSLTGLPPTAGFTAKLLVFSTLWEGYTQYGHPILLYLLVFGLLNTVVSLFYYLKIPYYMIFKEHSDNQLVVNKNISIENFLAPIMVLALLALFFKPDWLMRIVNSVSFAF